MSGTTLTDAEFTPKTGLNPNARPFTNIVPSSVSPLAGVIAQTKPTCTSTSLRTTLTKDFSSKLGAHGENKNTAMRQAQDLNGIPDMESTLDQNKKLSVTSTAEPVWNTTEDLTALGTEDAPTDLAADPRDRYVLSDALLATGQLAQGTTPIDLDLAFPPGPLGLFPRVAPPLQSASWGRADTQFIHTQENGQPRTWDDFWARATSRPNCSIPPLLEDHY